MSGSSEEGCATSVSPGDLLAGKYRVERVLGSGGMGIVVAARHEELDQLVAVKLLRPDLVQTDLAVARFLREARAAARIHSDHVARVFDVGTLDGGRVYMVMEHLSGSDLGALLSQRGPLPVEEAVGYVLEALEAVAHAHVQGIVHRDLKPSNLFLATRSDGTKRIKVLDFGISKTSSVLDKPASGDALTTADAILGSPGYMSPEQVKSSKTVDSRSDIWSMGVILYELLAGKQAFEGETIGEVLAKILEGPPEPLRMKRPGLPEDLEKAVMRCMESRRELRFQTVGELAAAITPFSSDAMRSMQGRISLVLGAPPEATTGDERAVRVSIPGEQRVSQTAATFEATKESGEGNAGGAGGADGAASTASLAAATWARKPARTVDSRRRFAMSIAALGALALIGIFAWRVTSQAASGARPELDPTREPTASEPRGREAATAIPMVAPLGESATVTAAPQPPGTAGAAAPSAIKSAQSADAKATPASAAPRAKPTAKSSIPADLLRDRD